MIVNHSRLLKIDGRKAAQVRFDAAIRSAARDDVGERWKRSEFSVERREDQTSGVRSSNEERKR